MRFYIALWAGKFINFLINVIDKSRGSNFSGEKAIKIDPKMIAGFKGLDPQKTLFITGTNGKSTSNNLIYHIFSADGKKVISNLEGANLMAGLATALIKNSSLAGKVKADYFIFEVDERFLPSIYRLLPAKTYWLLTFKKIRCTETGTPISYTESFCR